MSDLDLTLAGPDDLDAVLPMVADYHDFEGISSSAAFRRRAVETLIADATLGEIWLARRAGQVVGYLAVCFGYSIEFGGRDAFVDEFFLRPEARGEGLGKVMLETAARRLGEQGVRALHLEVAHDNTRAKRLYGGAGFVGREQFHLMSRDL